MCKPLKEQDLRLLFDEREWRLIGVSFLVSGLFCFCCRRTYKLGKTLQFRVLSVTEFPETP